MTGQAPTAGQPVTDFRVFVAGVGVDDGVDRLVRWCGALDHVQDGDKSWWRWRAPLQHVTVRPETSPVSTLSAANSVVLTWRL